MELSILERIVTLDVLPKEGNFLTLKAIRELRESLGFTEDEVKKFSIEVTVSEGNYTDYSWKQDGNNEVDIPMTEAKMTLIREELKVMDTNKTLEQKHYSLYEKFVVSKEEEDAKEK